MNRDGAMTSLWQQANTYKTANTAIKYEYDVLIVGGGITGLSTAFRLKESVPCHGSRFSMDGKLLTDPAHTDLKRIDLTD